MDYYVKTLTALGRVSEPDDVAKLVSFLGSSDSNFVTGQVSHQNAKLHVAETYALGDLLIFARFKIDRRRLWMVVLYLLRRYVDRAMDVLVGCFEKY